MGGPEAAQALPPSWVSADAAAASGVLHSAIDVPPGAVFSGGPPPRACGGARRRDGRGRRRARRPRPALATAATAAAAATTACSCLFLGALLSAPTAASLLGSSTGRGPPTPPGPRGLSDQSAHVGLGSHSGAVVAVGDFNRDRFVDVLVADTATLRSLQVRLWRHASFAFEAAPGSGIALDAPFKSVQTADMDGDGALDVLVSDGSDTVVWYGDGGGGFDGRTSALTGVGVDALVMDANADLRPDLFVGGEDGSRTFWINQGNGSFMARQWDFGGGGRVGGGGANDSVPVSAAATTASAGGADATGATARRLQVVVRRFATSRRSVGSPSSAAATAAVTAAAAARPASPPPEGGCPVVSPSSAAFVDMDGDCLPDLLLPTTCGLEVWSNPAAGGGQAAFWELTLPPGAVDRDAVVPTHRLFGRDVYDAASGDGMVVVSDFNADGAIDVGVLNSVRKSFVVHLNGPTVGVRAATVRSSDELCVPAVSWGLSVGGGLAGGAADFGATSLGPLFRKVTIPPTLRVGDFDLDGLPDVVGVSPQGHVQLYRNSGSWGTTEAVAALSATAVDHSRPAAWLSKRRRGRESAAAAAAFTRVSDDAALRLASDRDAVAATFFDIDESGRQDLLIIKRSNETRLVWNEHSAGTDSLFFKGTAATRSHHRQSAAGAASLTATATGSVRIAPLVGAVTTPTAGAVSTLGRLAAVAGASRPTAAAAAGASFKITFASRSGLERHACSQCPQSAHFALQPCACLFGLLHISNYIQEMAVGAGAASRAWANLMPNSLAVVWAAPAADPGEWRMESFPQGRGGQMLGVVAALAVGLAACGVGIAYLRHQERKEDWEERRERSERVSLFNFAAF